MLMLEQGRGGEVEVEREKRGKGNNDTKVDE
jgi:hypothetical protein